MDRLAGLLICTPHILSKLAPLYEPFNFVFQSSSLLRGMSDVIVVPIILELSCLFIGIFTLGGILDILQCSDSVKTVAIASVRGVYS